MDFTGLSCVIFAETQVIFRITGRLCTLLMCRVAFGGKTKVSKNLFPSSGNEHNMIIPSHHYNYGTLLSFDFGPVSCIIIHNIRK